MCEDIFNSSINFLKRHNIFIREYIDLVYFHYFSCVYASINNANQWLINQHAAAKRAKTNDNKPFDDLTLEATLICVLV